MNVYKIWIGHAPEPQVFKKYTDTWSILTDQVIIQVGNEYIEECLLDTDSPMMHWAIENKRWPLVNHYLRYWLLYRYGGIYMDLDVQVIKGFDFGGIGLWIGLESDRWINNCVMVASRYHPFFQDCMNYMDTMKFGTPEIELETGPRLVTNLIVKNTKWHPSKQSDPVRVNYKLHPVTVLPCRYFSPHMWNEQFDPKEITTDTYTVHYYEHSWK